MHRAAADELAIGIDRHLDPVQRAVHRDILDPLDAEVERGLPGGAEASGLGVAAQEVGADLGAADRAAGAGDAARIRKRLDKGALDMRFPPVGAFLRARDGGEGGQRAARGAGVLLVLRKRIRARDILAFTPFGLIAAGGRLALPRCARVLVCLAHR